MNDGKISLPPSALPRVTSGDISAAIKILSMPPNVPTDKPVQGEVVSHDKNIIVMKTEQGLVSLETKQAALASVQVGDVINIRIQQTAQLKIQNIQNAMLVELLSVNGQDVKSAAPSTTPATPSTPQMTVDQVVLPQRNMFEAFTALQAKLLGLPQHLDDDALAMVMKTLLRLPLQDPLPPALNSGFDTFRQLVALLQQANLLPAQQLHPESAARGVPEGLLTSLQNILQVKSDGGQNPLLQNPSQQFIQLQTILPGEKLSPNILVDIRNQLVNILTQINAQPLALNMQGTAQAGQGNAIVQNPAQLYTMPAIGIVLGMPNIASAPLQGNNLVLMTTPDGQILMGLLASAMQGAGGAASVQDGKALLPGTIFVIAFQPQTDKALSIPMLPIGMLTAGSEMIQSLNLGLGDTWPALDELWQTALAQNLTAPDAMMALRQTIPTPQAQQFPPALLFFLSVMKNGLFENWSLPDKLAGLNKAELVQQLLNDMRGLQTRLNDDGVPDSWKALPVPLQIGDQLVRLQFFYRYPEHDFADGDTHDDERNKHDKTRFVLNIPHTHLGDLQIDGLVQFKDLEMILRTERALPSQAEHDIRARYQAVLDVTGMHGNIAFQSGREHYIRV